MKTTTTNLLAVIVGVVIAFSSTRSFAQEPAKIDSNLLKRELETFERYLALSTNALGTADERMENNQSCDAVADALISALGNKDISSIKQDGFLERNERSDGWEITRRSYAERYQRTFSQTREVENKIESAVTRCVRICPEWKNFFVIYHQAAKNLRNSANAEKAINSIINQAQAAMKEGPDAAAHAMQEAFKQEAPDAPPIRSESGGQVTSGGGTADDGNITMTDSNGNTHMGGKKGADGKIYFNDGWVYDPATGQWSKKGKNLPGGYRVDGTRLIGPDGSPIPGVSVAPDGTYTATDPDGKTHTGGWMDENGVIHFPDGTTYNTKTGEWSRGGAASVSPISNDPSFDEREYTDEEGKSVKVKVRAQYQGRIEEGKLDREDVKRSNGSSERIDWAFQINQGEEEKAGDGYKLTFELINTGSPKDAPFTVKAWTGPEGRKDTTDKQFTAVFPKSGEYVIKVEGETKYRSKFIIMTTVKF